jgi:dipeptidyl aminopeptidase/acylaminoacyl peptidase
MKNITKTAFFIALLALSFSSAKEVFAFQIDRISVSSSGVQANLASQQPLISTNARYVVFNSKASNLVPNDTNNSFDAFVRDRNTGTIERVSISNTGVEGNSNSWATSISSDGRYVVIVSTASNLVPNDTNNSSDTFLYDRTTDSIERVSVGSNGLQGNLTSYSGSVSDNGNLIAFWSTASNLVPNDTNSSADVFVYNRATQITQRININNNGNQASNGYADLPLISGNGRYVAFSSSQTGLFSNDASNNFMDAFVYDLNTSTLKRISQSLNEEAGNSDSIATSISNDGRYIVFTSRASNLVSGDTLDSEDIFVYDNNASSITRVISGTSAWAGIPSISNDGRFVAFYSESSNLVPNDTNGVSDIFVFDRNLSQIKRVSVGSSSNQANAASGGYAIISGDGSHVTFVSLASNLVPNDTNGVDDVFVKNIKRVIVDAETNKEPGPVRPTRTTITVKPETKKEVILQPVENAIDSLKATQQAAVIKSIETKETLLKSKN